VVGGRAGDVYKMESKGKGGKGAPLSEMDRMLQELKVLLDTLMCYDVLCQPIETSLSQMLTVPVDFTLLRLCEPMCGFVLSLSQVPILTSNSLCAACVSACLYAVVVLLGEGRGTYSEVRTGGQQEQLQ
jgi:hypothetical protein